jgi:hypothetical protein
MVVHLVRFFQRYAAFFCSVTGVIAYRLVLPDDSPWWLKFAVGAPVAVAVYLLLYKDGITENREDGERGLSKLAIVGYSVSYWLLVPAMIFIIAVGNCASEADRSAVNRCFDGQTRLLIISIWLAAVVYALGLWAVIRARQRSSS